MWLAIIFRVAAFQLAVLAAVCAAEPLVDTCASTLSALKVLDPALLLTWRETSMTDAKPLILAFSDGESGLLLDLHKAGEGLWATGLAKVCRRGLVLETQLTSTSHGPAAPWLFRRATGARPIFVLQRLNNDELKVSTTGWTGTFIRVP